MVGRVNVSDQPGGITDEVLLRTWHTESREWLPNATRLPSVINLSCCHWLPRDSPHDSRRVTSARTTRGLSPRPWRHCRGVRSVQVHSMWINAMWISYSFRRAAARSTETTNSPTQNPVSRVHLLYPKIQAQGTTPYALFCLYNFPFFFLLVDFSTDVAS